MAYQAILRKVLQCTCGVAMVEFALGVPILLFMLLGGLELTNLMLTHMRISQIALTVADNAGRVRTGIDESNIYEVFAGANLVGQDLEFENRGRVVLSSLEPNGRSGTRAGQRITWQRCFGGLAVAPRYGLQGAGATDASLAAGMGPAGNRITAANATAVMFVEVSYDYRPVILESFQGVIGTIRYESAFNVRERTNQAITNTQGLSVRSC